MAPTASKPTDLGSRGEPGRPRSGQLSMAALVILLGVLLGVGACSSPPPVATGTTGPSAAPTVDPTATPATQREQAQALWSVRGPAHYRFIWTTSAMVGTTRVVVEVRDHRVVSTTVLDEDRGPDDRAGRTVEDVFAELADEQRDADTVSVVYDPTLGYPARVEVDQERNAVDDEHSFAIESFGPA